MSNAKLSRRCLKAMRRACRADGCRSFNIAYFHDIFPSADDESLFNALRALSHQGYVSLLDADDGVYQVTLLSCEQPVKGNGQHGDDDVVSHQPRHRKLNTVLRWIFSVFGAIIAALAAAWIMSRFG